MTRAGAARGAPARQSPYSSSREQERKEEKEGGSMGVTIGVYTFCNLLHIFSMLLQTHPRLCVA